MKIVQISKLNSTQATLECLQANATAWQDIPGFATAVSTLEETVQAILDRSRKQSFRTGYAAQKTDARQTMVNAAFTVASALKACASASGDKQLFSQVDFSRTDLTHGREADVLNRCQAILDLGTANAKVLAAKYNVSASDLTAFKTAIQEFTSVQPKPRQGLAASASATAELVELFAAVDKVLQEQIDPLVEKFKQSNPAFYNEYQKARVIVDNAATHPGAPNTPAAQPVPKAA